MPNNSGIRISENLPNQNTEISFFNPRKEQWKDHFQIDVEAGNILGRTPARQVTAECLGMNSVAQVTARQLWIRLGLFP